MRFLIHLAVAVAALSAAAFADPPRLKIKYDGAVRMPTVANSAKGSSFGASIGPGVDTPDGSFVMWGIPTLQGACIIKPSANAWKTLANKDYAKLSQAALVQGWHDPTYGKIAELNAESAVTPGQGHRVSGAVFDAAGNGYFLVFRYYNVQNESLPSLFRVARDGTTSPTYFCGDFHGMKTSYYLGRDASGKLWCGSSQAVASGSAGPSAYRLDGFDPTLPHRSQQPATEFMYWPLQSQLVWQAPAPHVGGDHFYRNKPDDSWRPEPQKWLGSWNCKGMFIIGGSVCYLIQRPLGPSWYGNAIVGDDVTVLETPRTNARGYNHVAYATSIYEFPNLIASSGADRSYREIAGLQHRLFDTTTSVSSSFNPETNMLYVTESQADRATDGPVLHRCKLLQE